MRIISGKFKGLNLHSPKDNEIRPTSDRLRESLFSIIGSEKYNANILNANVIDICTGTGALGIESLSRGASNLFLIDMAQDAIKIVKKNISKIKPQNIENTLIRIIKADARKPFKNINLVFDIVFIDPPYNSNIIQECLVNLKENNLINVDSVIFAETSKKEILDLPDFEILETKKYGKSKLTIIKLLELSSIK